MAPCSFGEVDMPAHSKTLEQRIEQGIARHQFTLNAPDDPECRVTCNWCGESLLIDYFQFGYHEMTIRVNNFTRQHGSCEPTWKTKPKDMILTPKEKAV